VVVGEDAKYCWPGGGEAKRLGVVLPDPKNISLLGVPLAEAEDAGLYTTESMPRPLSALRLGGWPLPALAAMDVVTVAKTLLGTLDDTESGCWRPS